MAPRKFENTSWGVWHPERKSADGWSKPGWEMPSHHGRYIGSNDHQYWDRVLDDARKTYGDPNIRYNTDDPFKERYLVFGDGTRLPSDGTVVYHDGHTKQNIIQNDDGTVQLAGPDGKAVPGTPEAPAAYRRGPDGQVAPVNAHGQQVGPLMGDVPKDKGQGYYDNGHGVLTPTNARGDYYTLDDNGNKHYFDRSGHPISKEQYDGTPGGPGAPPADGGGDGLSTDEENSGRAADAIRKVKSDAEHRNSNLHEADAKLAELMLSAHASSADGRAALEGMQQDIVSALNDPKSNLDTPAGELQFLKLLRDKAGAASDLVKSGKLTDADRAKMAEALADFYRQGANGTSNQAGDQPPQQPGDPTPGLTPGAPPAGVPDSGPGLGAQPGMPYPSLGDPGLGDGGLGAGSPMGDMLSSAAPLIPSLLSGLGSPLSGGGLGGGPDLGSVTKPISDAIESAADHGHKDDDKSDSQPNGKGGDKPADKPGDKPAEASTATNPSQQQPAPTPAQGTVPDHALTPPPAPGQTTVVDLKDGSSVTAADPSRAGAVRSALTGTAVGEAYRLNNLAAPPPGTTLTNYIPPDQLQPGDYAMYHDKLIMVLGPDKFVGEDGQVQSLKQLPQGSDFLGFGRPSALTPPAGAPAAAPAAQAPPPAAVPPPTPPAPPTPGPASAPQ